MQTEKVPRPFNINNHIGGVMVGVLASSAIADRLWVRAQIG